MKRKFSQRHQLSTVSELNVTPLLDLAFVLLIIFMITTPLIENSTDLILPSGNAQGTPVKNENVHSVSIHADGHLDIDGKTGTLDDIESTLAQLAAKEPETGVVIRPHKDNIIQPLTDVLEAAKRAGVKRVGFANSPKSE
jgi:biopolymer transport protein ExbD